MKKLSFLLLFAISLTSQAQHDSVSSSKSSWPTFLTVDQLPDGSAYLPVPPSFGSTLFVSDMVWNHWGKTLRDTPRGEQARRDANIRLTALLQMFSEPFGALLSEEQYPALAYLLERVKNDCFAATRKAKRHFDRQRPFLYFNEGTLIPEEEDTHHTPSYPSSHAAVGWGLALVLSELNPGRAEALLKAGYEYGQSRVIAGFHYQSDVDAGRMTASACVARLHADKAFQKQLSKVRDELTKIAMRQ